jgi:PAS domain S-box-containing protein
VSVDEFLSEVKTVFDVLTEDGKAFAAANFSHTLKEGASQKNEYLVRIRDGSNITVEINSSVIKSATGEPMAFISVIRDISERKQTEDALRDSEEFLSSIIENIPNMIFVKDAETLRFVKFNKEGEKLLGQNRQDLIGKNDYGFFPKSQADFFTERDREVLKNKQLVDIPEEPIQTRHLGERILHTKKIPIIDREGNARYLLGISEDITDLKQAENLYRTLADSSHAGVFIAQDGIFQFVNPHIQEYSGYSEAEIVGSHSLTYVHPDDREITRLHAIEMLKGKRRIPYEYRIISRNGDTKLLIETVRSITYGGKKAVLGNTMDITERYQMEGLLRQAQKMESIGTLAGGIAHDFNNILGAILGYTEMALANQRMDDRQRHYLEQVFRAAERARDLVKQILTFSRQKEQEKKPVLIAPIIKEGIKLLRSSLPTTIKITQSIKDTSLMVLADPTQIHQVVMNLCTNASHAMRERGGVLDIQLVRERIEHFGTPHPLNLAAGDYAKVTVSDTGHGIDATIMDRIFDPFFTTKGPGEGTGLGLSVVYGIVSDHGGGIGVSSERGRGTTITVYFPLIETEEPIKEPVPEAIPESSESILFIDDEATLAELGSMLLSSLGYDVTTRTSSIEALEAFRAGPYGFDLVIADMTMPNMRGDDLARELLKVRPDIPIILCTGFSEMISEEKAKNLGIRQLIMKPVSKKDLAQAIRDVLDTQ